MSLVQIQSALEKKLAAMVPSIDIAYENESYTPTVGVPYIRVNFMPNETKDITISADVREFYGLFQIMLCYPGGDGRGNAQAKADAIDLEFKPVQRLTEGLTQIELIESVSVAGGFNDGDRWVVPVTVPWTAFTN